MSAEILRELTRAKVAFQLRALRLVMGLRDSGSDPSGEDAPAAEGEASQNGAVKQAHRPNPPTTGVPHG